MGPEKIEGCALYQIQDLRMHWISLQHKDGQAMVEKTDKEVHIQGDYSDVFLCPRKQSQSYNKIMVIKEMIVREQQGPVAL